MITQEQLPWVEQADLDEANELFASRAGGDVERLATMEEGYISRRRQLRSEWQASVSIDRAMLLQPAAEAE